MLEEWPASVGASATKLLGVGAVVFGLMVSSVGESQAQTANLDFLLRQKKFVEVERVLSSASELSPRDRSFFEGVMANRRNRTDQSIRLLKPLIPALTLQDKERAVVALRTLADDYEKSFRYADAADTYSQLDRQFGADMSATERQRAKRGAVRWNLLRGMRPQTAIVDEPFRVQTTRDPMGLPEVTVSIKQRRVSVILDTGANLCTISRSAARRLGLKLSTAQATSRGSSGALMPVRTTVVSEMRLGRARLPHVAFMVLDDKDLAFPDLKYRVPGSLGFPVLLALGNVALLSNSSIHRSSVSQGWRSGRRARYFGLL